MEKSQRVIELEAVILEIDRKLEIVNVQMESVETQKDDKKISLSEYVLGTTDLQLQMTQLIEEREACHRKLLDETEQR